MGYWLGSNHIDVIAGLLALNITANLNFDPVFPFRSTKYKELLLAPEPAAVAIG